MWWQRRTRLERRLSLCVLFLVFVAFGLVIGTAMLIYSSQYPDSISNIITATQDKSEMADRVCDTSVCVLAGKP